MTSAMERLDKYCGQVQTQSGPASYIDTGAAPPPGRPSLMSAARRRNRARDKPNATTVSQVGFNDPGLPDCRQRSVNAR
jgi:hypothetical protein